MAYDVSQLLAVSQTQLDDLFRASPAGEIPDGLAEGTAIIGPGFYLGKVYWGKERLIDFCLKF